MCNFQDDFKLCTCDAEQLQDKDIGWVLSRYNKEYPISSRRGKIFIYQFTVEEKACKAKLLSFLNTKNCFDFEYRAIEGDTLRIRMKKENVHWAAFRFLDGVWGIDTSNKFTSWRSQMVQLKEGVL